MTASESLLDANTNENASQFLTFVLSDEQYGIYIKPVREIIQYSLLTSIPLVSDFIAGVINLRGNVVPVINLASRLNLPEHEKTKRTCIVILDLNIEGNIITMGFIVDKVLQVVDIPEDNLKPRPQFGANIDSRFIDKMADLDEVFIIILKVENLLTFEDIEALDQINAE